MKIDIDRTAEGIRFQMSQEAHDPLDSLVAFNSATQRLTDTTDATDNANTTWTETPFLKVSALVRGPFAGEAVASAAAAVASTLAWSVEYRARKEDPSRGSCKDIDRNSLPPYPVECVLDGQSVTLEALFDLLAPEDAAHDLGVFEVSCGRIRVTDPCYTRDTWCTGTFDAQAGRWAAMSLIGKSSWGVRVKQLRIRHESALANVFDDLSGFEKADIDAGVDSGQCGFFDDANYPVDAEQFEYEDGTFYGRLCEMTLDRLRPGGGVIEFGACTSSGFGDGSYDVYVLKQDGKAIAAYLLFIDDDEEDEDDDPL